jgi:mitogen-activated protein kinase kinase
MGSPYSVKSDVWSLGITLMELALGRFPFPPEGTPLSIFELLQHIVHEPVPTFPPNKYPQDLTDFVAKWYYIFRYTCYALLILYFIV